MVKSNRNHKNSNSRKNNNRNNNNKISKQYKRLASMGRSSVNIINDLYNPVDAINRFINLALQHIGEDSQGRQFLLESKSGVRRMTALLKRLNNYAKRIEEEMRKIAEIYE